MRLDRYLSKYQGLSRKTILNQLQLRQISVDGQVILDRHFEVNQFSKISLEGRLIEPQQALYIMLHKPAGILSATEDPIHPTAIDLIDINNTNNLHIAGRLDRATTGLLILTNDGKWSRQLTEPKQKIPKKYWVETEFDISNETAVRFQEGIYFDYEGLTTSPAEIEIITTKTCYLTIYEGRYHQVKRMFKAIGNRVVKLHREKMGEIVLDKHLKPGDFRALSQTEIDSVWQNHS